MALPLPRVEGLPDGAESTNNIPHDKIGLLFEAFDGLAAPLAVRRVGARALPAGGAAPAQAGRAPRPPGAGRADAEHAAVHWLGRVLWGWTSPWRASSGSGP